MIHVYWRLVCALTTLRLCSWHLSSTRTAPILSLLSLPFAMQHSCRYILTPEVLPTPRGPLGNWRDEEDRGRRRRTTRLLRFVYHLVVALSRLSRYATGTHGFFHKACVSLLPTAATQQLTSCERSACDIPPAFAPAYAQDTVPFYLWPYSFAMRLVSEALAVRLDLHTADERARTAARRVGCRSAMVHPLRPASLRRPHFLRQPRLSPQAPWKRHP